jgi:tetratricopeptide (TPR) repeat protein
VAIQQLNLANRNASRGRYDDALAILVEARRLAVSSDDPYLRVRTSISRGEILFSMGRHEEAFSEWENASGEGDSSGEPVLASLARIYAIRAKLVLLANGVDPGTAADADAGELRAQVNREIAVVRNDELSSAAAYITRGLAEKELGRWAEAESAVRRALDIHEKSGAFEEWDNASKEGDSSGEPVLAALARIYVIRAKLVQLTNGTRTDVDAEELRAQINQEIATVRNDDLSSAAAYVTLGLAEKELGRWAEAESAVRRALDIHEKGGALEDSAYDWFLIASIRSVAGNYNGSLDALRSAIGFDRRAENGFGLASSWQAMGDANEKAGRIQDAQAAWRRAAEIYRAIGLSAYAERLENQL